MALATMFPALFSKPAPRAAVQTVGTALNPQKTLRFQTFAPSVAQAAGNIVTHAAPAANNVVNSPAAAAAPTVETSDVRVDALFAKLKLFYQLSRSKRIPRLHKKIRTF